MKKTQYLLLLMVFAFSACNDDFLERYPLDSINQQSFWNSATDLKTYTSTFYFEAGNDFFYEFYMGHSDGLHKDTRSPDPYGSKTQGLIYQDSKSDNLATTYKKLKWNYNLYKIGKQNIGSKPGAGSWHWGFLRLCNVFLENYQKAEETDVVKNAYAGEARLFRAWFYFDKVRKFGDVPWIGHSLNIDSPELNKGRDPRATVMDSVLVDLDYAIQWMPDDWGNGESPGHINRWGALGIKSRICLFEGTFRKYHGLPGAEKFLQEAANAAKEIIDGGQFSLADNYGNMFIQKDFSGNPEVMIWRKYVDGINGTFIVGYHTTYVSVTKDAVEDYLCTDGLPITLSPEYQGDSIIENVFLNRDFRLRATVLHPADSKGIIYRNSNTYTFPRFPGMAGGNSRTGYMLRKFYDNELDIAGYGHCELAAIVLRYAEVQLNYAEAKAELGTLTQADLDMTINEIRDRVGLPHMILNPPMDPKYASDGLSSNIIEIRRERRAELMAEGFRYFDLLRWKWGEKLNVSSLGMRWEQAQIDRYPGASVKTIPAQDAWGNTHDYIDVFPSGSALGDPDFDDKDYFWPTPLSVIAENPSLGQSPGW